MKEAMTYYHQIDTSIAISKDELEDAGKSIKNVLYVPQYAEATSNSKKTSLSHYACL